MIDDKYLQMAISIRRTYLKIINNVSLYQSKAKQISDKLQETVDKLDKFKDELEDDSNKKNISQVEAFKKLLDIINEVEEEGKRLEKMVDPMNLEIEKLAKQETELYNLIVDNYPNLTQDQIVKEVWDRLVKEGL